jgi:hypothetical protein
MKTVAELIEELKRYPPDILVVTKDWDNDHFEEQADIEYVRIKFNTSYEFLGCWERVNEDTDPESIPALLII